MAYHGSQFACSPRYIFEGLWKKMGDKLEYVWCLEKDVESVNSRCIVVKPNSIRYYVSLMTSSVIIHNVYIPPWLPYRKKQIIINTWHGGGLGKLPYAHFESLSWYNRRLLRFRTNYFLSSSEKFSSLVIRGTFGYSGSVIESGLPRNDILFSTENKYPVRKFYGISENTQIIVYAPTYRDVESKAYIEFNLETVCYEWQKRTGKQTIALVRYHPLSNAVVRERNNVLDGSRYRNMQDILKEADCLITDYSSSIWDYCLMHKPCILYIPDEEEYADNRQLYMRPTEFHLPFCKSENDLITIIREFSSDDYAAADKAYLLDLGSFETGKATKMVVDIILDNIDGKK